MNMTYADSNQDLETSQWRLRLDDLDPDIRVEIRALYRVRPWSNFVVFLYPALWICSIAMVERWPALPVLLAGVVVIGICIHAMGALMHEALHGNLFRSHLLDQWAGFLLGVPTLFSATAYKVVHLNHHRHTRTEKDQDEFSYSCRTHQQYVALFYASFLVGSILYMVLVPMKAYAMASRESRRRIITEYSLMFLVFATTTTLAIMLGHPGWLFCYWLMPIVVAVLLSNVRALSEHMGTPGKGDAIAKTRTVTSNRLVSFLMCNLNYHLEHHLFPGVPWYNLPRIHELLKPMYESRGAVVQRSYAAYALQCLRRIPDPVEKLPMNASPVLPSSSN
jgi:fatty acid desaturase